MGRRLTILTLFYSLLMVSGAPALETRLLASVPTPYVGQAFELDLEVHHRSGEDLSLAKWPELQGLVLETSLSPSVRRPLAGNHEVVEYLRRQVRPLRPGPLVLGRQGMSPGRLRIRVRPLPTTGRPADFSGMVGRVSWRIEDPVGTGQRNLTLVLEGDADLARAENPLSVSAGDELTLLEDRHERNGREARRRLRYLYRPRNLDDAKPAVRLTWFDPASGHYRQVGQPPGNTLLILLPALSGLLAVPVMAWHLRRRRRVRSWVEESLASGSRRQRLEVLRSLGCPPGVMDELDAFWQRLDRRFSPPPVEIQSGRAPRGLVRRLQPFIDKIDKRGRYRQ